MARCTLPLWAVVTIWIVVCVVAASMSVFGVMYSATRDQQTAWNAVLSESLKRESTRMVDELMHDLREAAQAVYDVEALLQECAMPASDYNPGHLVRLFNALSSAERPLGSLGIIQRAPGDGRGKVSWQVAAGYGCAAYMYARAEPASYPNFTGTCVYPLNGTLYPGPPSYTGTDWGLKPEEDALLARPPGAATVLPIFPLIGYYTLTYEQTVGCNGSTSYAAVFAEQSLAKLDRSIEALAGNDTTAASSILVLLVERPTGNLVSASVPNQTQRVKSPTDIGRVHMTQASDERVRAIAQAMGGRTDNITTGVVWTETDDWITAVPYTSGVDWVIVAAFPQASFLQTLRRASAFSIGLSMGIVALTLVLSLTASYFCMARPLGIIARMATAQTLGQEYERVENESFMVGEIDALHAIVTGSKK